MKTIKICCNVYPYYCPKCKALYFVEVECKCDGDNFMIEKLIESGIALQERVEKLEDSPTKTKGDKKCMK